MWSCQRISAKEHEQAVIVVNIEERTNESYVEMVKNMKFTAGKYLPRSFMSKFKWPKEVLNSSAPALNPFHCPAEEPKPYIVIGVFAVLLSLLGILVILNLNGWPNEARNQVLPLEIQ